MIFAARAKKSKQWQSFQSFVWLDYEAIGGEKEPHDTIRTQDNGPVNNADIPILGIY